MDDYVKIKVGNQQAGIIGLKSALAEVAEDADPLNDKQIGPRIREKLAGKNYFAPAAVQLYDQAFLREYKKFRGLPVGAETEAGASIKVLGPGCPRCRQLRDMVLQALTMRGLAADFSYVTDPLEIAGEGIVLTPALIINGEVKVSGRLPNKAEIEKWIDTIKP